MSASDLLELRLAALDELANALRAGADAGDEHLRAVALLIGRVEKRLLALDD